MDTDFYFKRLHIIRQFSTVDFYQKQFELLQSIVVVQYPHLDEAYIVSCCIKGLKDEIRSTVLSLRPSSVDVVFRIARLKEYWLSYEARQSSTLGFLTNADLANFVHANVVDVNASDDVNNSDVPSTDIVGHIKDEQVDALEIHNFPATTTAESTEGVIQSITYLGSLNNINGSVNNTCLLADSGEIQTLCDSSQDPRPSSVMPQVADKSSPSVATNCGNKVVPCNNKDVPLGNSLSNSDNMESLTISELDFSIVARHVSVIVPVASMGYAGLLGSAFISSNKRTNSVEVTRHVSGLNYEHAAVPAIQCDCDAFKANLDAQNNAPVPPLVIASARNIDDFYVTAVLNHGSQSFRLSFQSCPLCLPAAKPLCLQGQARVTKFSLFDDAVRLQGYLSGRLDTQALSFVVGIVTNTIPTTTIIGVLPDAVISLSNYLKINTGFVIWQLLYFWRQTSCCNEMVFLHLLQCQVEHQGISPAANIQSQDTPALPRVSAVSIARTTLTLHESTLVHYNKDHNSRTEVERRDFALQRNRNYADCVLVNDDRQSLIDFSKSAGCPLALPITSCYSTFTKLIARLMCFDPGIIYTMSTLQVAPAMIFQVSQKVPSVVHAH